MLKDTSMKVIPDRVIISPTKERPYSDTFPDEKTEENEGKVVETEGSDPDLYLGFNKPPIFK